MWPETPGQSSVCSLQSSELKRLGLNDGAPVSRLAQPPVVKDFLTTGG
jgi:hypothetical protein